MPKEENKEVVRRVFEEVWTKKTLKLIDDLYDPNFVNHNPDPNQTPDREGLKQGIKNVLDAFPDIKVTIEDLIAENDKVVARVTITGTHKGKFISTLPTNRQITFPVITINRFASHKIIEKWSLSDSLAMLLQLGVIPPLQQSS